MGIISVSDKGIGVQIRGKIGNAGDPDPEGVLGIYQVRKSNGKQVVVKKGFYTPTNPQTPAQQAWRAIFAAAISAWQGLTAQQKDLYNQRAKYRPLSGHNLYLREYLLSH